MRLTGDGSSYVKMLEQAQQGTKQAADVVQQHTRQIEQFGKSLEGYVSTAASALGALGAGGVLKSAFSAFEGRELGMVRMSAALRANGRDVAAVTAEYRSFAKALSDTSTASVGEILNTLRASEAHGLTGAAAKRATQDALALSYAVHGNAEAMEPMLRLTAAMQEGNIDLAMRAGRLVPALRGVRDESEFLAKYQRLVSTGMLTAAESANTSYGAMQKLGNAIKGLKGDLGEIVAEGVKPFVQILTAAIGWFRDLDKSTKTVIVAVLGLVAGFLAIGPAVALITMLAGLFSPLAIAVIAVGAALGGLVESLGGVGAVWDAVKNAAMSAWNWIKSNTQTVMAIIWAVSPPLAALIVLIMAIVRNWGAIKAAAGVAWDYVKGLIAGFIAWATPAFMAWLDFVKTQWFVVRAIALNVWDALKVVVGGFIAWARPILAAYINWLVGVWTAVRDAGIAAWGYVKEKLAAFVTWAEPVVAAWIGYVAGLWDLISTAAGIAWDWIKDVAVAAWGYIKDAAVAFWGWITDMWAGIVELAGGAWDDISGGASVTWQDVQDFIVECFIAAEFAMRNFGDVASYVWTATKLGAVVLFNEVEHFFTVALPTYLRWFGENWASVFSTAFSYAEAGFRNLFGNIADIAANFPRLISGQLSLADIWRPLSTGATNWIRGLPTVAAREVGAVEQQLRREFEAQGAALSESYDAFRRRRLEEISRFHFRLPEDAYEEDVAAAARQAAAAGEQVGGAYARAAGQAADRLESVLRRSADALAHISAYAERNSGVFQATGTAASASGSLLASAPASTPAATSRPPEPAAGAPGGGPISSGSADATSATGAAAIVAELRLFKQAINAWRDAWAARAPGAVVVPAA